LSCSTFKQIKLDIDHTSSVYMFLGGLLLQNSHEQQLTSSYPALFYFILPCLHCLAFTTMPFHFLTLLSPNILHLSCFQ